MDELVCYACDRRFDLDHRDRCTCGEPLWIDVDATGFDWPDGGPWSMWRYGSLLPVEPPDGIATAAGGTPLVRTPRLDVDGCRVHVKDETENPTGSFKDRGSAMGVSAAVHRGVGRVGTVSHGNMAISMAATAAGHGLACTVLVPADIPEDRLGHIARYDPRILRVEGPYGELYHESLALDAPIAFVNSDTPYRVEGQKTVALEVLETFAPEVPDAIVLPVSSGGQCSGIWKALGEAADAGLIDRPPRLFAAQSEARAPIVQAFERGDDVIEPVEPKETIAYSIGNVDPPSGARVLAALRDTDGGAVAVADDELEQARDDMARRAGICVEPSSAVALAGLRRLCEHGEIDAGEDVVVIATGTGFREPGDAAAVRSTTVDLDDLAGAL